MSWHGRNLHSFNQNLDGYVFVLELLMICFLDINPYLFIHLWNAVFSSMEPWYVIKISWHLCFMKYVVCTYRYFFTVCYLGSWIDHFIKGSFDYNTYWQLFDQNSWWLDTWNWKIFRLYHSKWRGFQFTTDPTQQN